MRTVLCFGFDLVTVLSAHCWAVFPIAPAPSSGRLGEGGEGTRAWESKGSRSSDREDGADSASVTANNMGNILSKTFDSRDLRMCLKTTQS